MKREKGIMVRFGLLLAVIMMLYAGEPVANAQESPTGVLNAVVFKPVPAGEPILVRPLDDTDENLAIQKNIEAALTSRGYAIGTDPKGIVLSFETRSQKGYWTNPSRRTFLHLEGSAGTGTSISRGNRKSSRAVVNLYDSQQGGVVNKGNRNIVTPAATYYRLDVSIDNKTDGKSLWRAWALANLAEGNAVTLSRAMVPAIVDNIGKGAKEQSFKLQ